MILAVNDVGSRVSDKSCHKYAVVPGIDLDRSEYLSDVSIIRYERKWLALLLVHPQYLKNWHRSPD